MRLAHRATAILALGGTLGLARPAAAAPPPLILDGWNGPLVALGDVGPFTAPLVALGCDDELARFAREVHATFPRGNEVFAALLGDPAFLPVTAGPLPPASSGALGMAMAVAGDGRHGSGQVTFSNRSWASFMAAPGIVGLGGREWELLDAFTVSPLVLDLAGGGVFEAGGGQWTPHPGNAWGPFAPFDIDGDGFTDVTEWLPPGLAFVATTPEPRSGRDLVGSSGGWADGFEKLLRRDLDGDGDVSGDELRGLFAWEDADLDGVADPGETTPLLDLGVQWISTQHSNFLGAFGIAVAGAPVVERACWDFWPSYARANLVPTAGSDPPPPAPLACSAGACPRWLRELTPALQAAGPAMPRPGRSAGQGLIPPAELAAKGIDPETFDVIAIEREGRLLVGSDLAGVPRHARLVLLDRESGQVRAASLPLHEIQQAKVAPHVDRALVIGDGGSRLALVLLPSGRVVPEGGLDLRALGLRAAGVAGWAGVPWLLAWRLDGECAARELMVFGLTTRGFEPGLSLTALGSELGPVRQHFVVSPDEAFLVTATSSGLENLWHVRGSERTLLADADAFGGIAAVAGAAAWCERLGSSFVVERWDALGGRRDVAFAREPLFYPFLASAAAPVAFTTIDAEERRLLLHVEDGSGSGLPPPLLVTVPGQTKTGPGALAHRTGDGVLILPLPPAPAE